MRDYFLRIAKVLNVLLLLTIVGGLLFGGSGSIDGPSILFIVLAVVTPAFTLFVLHAPDEK